MADHIYPRVGRCGSLKLHLQAPAGTKDNLQSIFCAQHSKPTALPAHEQICHSNKGWEYDHWSTIWRFQYISTSVIHYNMYNYGGTLKNPTEKQRRDSSSPLPPPSPFFLPKRRATPKERRPPFIWARKKREKNESIAFHPRHSSFYFAVFISARASFSSANLAAFVRAFRSAQHRYPMQPMHMAVESPNTIAMM